MSDFTNSKLNMPELGQVYPRLNYDLGAIHTFADAGAGTTNSADQVNPGSRGIIVVVDITDKSGTIDVVVNIQRKDKASGKYTTLLASASLTAAGTVTMIVHPELTAAANTIAKDFIGENWRIQVVSGAGSTPSFDATVGACLIP